MASSGSSARGGSGSKGFDFASDDVLCSYDDFGNQENSNGKHADTVNSGKDFRESRMGRSSFLPVYNQQDESLGQEVISTVEKTMKKYADNLMRFLEGISARLSQLELYCYNLEKSIGDMRAELNRENGEADSKLRSLDKHLQEVHRSIQILRDKQELADTQKELAKLQLQKDSTTHNEEGVPTSSADLKKLDNTPEVQNQQLVLALPQQINPPTSLLARSMEQHQPMPPSQTPSQNVVQTQQRPYYQQQNQLPSPSLQSHLHSQDQYMQADSQYQRAQLQVSQSAPQPLQAHVVQPQQVPSFPSYQQQWLQPYPQQVVQQSQSPPQPQPPPSQQTQIAPPNPAVYASYPSSQPVSPSPETFSGSTQLQGPFPGIPQSGVSRPEAVGYGYGGTTPRPALQQQQPPLHNMQPQSQQNTYGSPLSESSAYPVGGGSQATQGPRQGYATYDGPPHFPQGGYPPPGLQNPPPPGRQSNSSQQMVVRGQHPYSEMAEKASSMGYARDYVVSVMRRMEESGQPMDFNSLLDRLNSHSSGGGSQRSW